MQKLYYSYLSLPKKFYSITKPNSFPNPQTFLFNNKLNLQFNKKFGAKEELIKTLFNKQNNKSFAQAYAGHQFGNFTKLGDGRSLMIGEFKSDNNEVFDIQLKGSGRTLYSRNGDGKATLKTMLREFLVSEAMHYLNISSSRSLALIKTGEKIYRDEEHDGGLLVRIMKSHIRIGTFEYANYFGSKYDLKKLTDYSINRLYPEIKQYENTTLELLNIVLKNQINLVVNWLRVGFIHGVMNTDNTSISSETFDYGPCAFMNKYNPNTVFSSLDYYGRYSYENQPKIIKWNICRFAESLLPIIGENSKKSFELVQSVIDSFDEIWNKKYYEMMLTKIGIQSSDSSQFSLVDELLTLMNRFNLDYTNTFLYLTYNKKFKNSSSDHIDFILWEKKWKSYINLNSSTKKASDLMKVINPVFVPRNHIVEKVIDEAVCGNQKSFNNFLDILSEPYNYTNKLKKFMTPPQEDYEKCFQTYCGT